MKNEQLRIIKMMQATQKCESLIEETVLRQETKNVMMGTLMIVMDELETDRQSRRDGSVLVVLIHQQIFVNGVRLDFIRMMLIILKYVLLIVEMD